MKAFAKPTVCGCDEMQELEGLKDLGPSGAFISMMATAVAGLSAAVGIQWRQANKVYGYRLAERDTLNKALTDSTGAMIAATRAIQELKEVTERLADAIERQANAFERVNDRAEMQHANLMGELGRHGNVVSETSRVYSQTITEIRGFLQTLITRRQPR